MSLAAASIALLCPLATLRNASAAGFPGLREEGATRVARRKRRDGNFGI
jgi:hypothetical protein